MKLLGDSGDAVVRGPGGRRPCGLQLVDAATAEAMLRIRVGISSGPVVFRDGDYYGRTVNLAARVVDRIGPDQVVLTGEARESIRCVP